MYEVDLSKKIVDIKGTEYPETYGEVIADLVLARATEGPVVTMMKWAVELNANRPISINQRDREMIRGMIESNKLVCNYIKLYVMNILDDLQDTRGQQP